MQYGGFPAGYPWAGLPFPPVEIEVEFDDNGDFGAWGPYGKKIKFKGRGRPFRGAGFFPPGLVGKPYGKPFGKPYGKFPVYGQEIPWGQLF